MIGRFKSGKPRNSVRKPYLVAFVFSCLLFWWLPSLLFHLAGMPDPVHNWTLVVSFLALGAFIAGYKIRPLRFQTLLPNPILDGCERLSYLSAITLSIPALIVSIRFFLARSGVAYGTGQGISGTYQAILYLHMFVALLYLGVARTDSGKNYKVLIAALLLILPRLIISLHWGRFFVAQALVPVMLIALARGWMRLTRRRVFQFALLGLAVMLVPSLTRGDRLAEQGQFLQFFASGSTLKLYQDNTDLNLAGRCPPLLVSLTAQIFPYHALGVCTIDVWGEKNLPATLDRILAYNEPGTEGTLEGPGANYILELYLTGGILAILLGSLLFGYTNCCFIDWISRRSLYAGIWAECLTRSMLAPRSTLGYVYERVPGLVLATWAVVLVVYVAQSELWRLKSPIASPAEE